MNSIAVNGQLPAAAIAHALNHGCYCHTLDPERLRKEFEADPSMQGLMQSIALDRPHLFSSTAVFITPAMQRQIAGAVAAIERVVAREPYRRQALARASAIAGPSPGPLGACMGYDFHLSDQGPRLIEVNTNAGGLLLNAALARAQVSCCEAMDMAFAPQPSALPTEQVVIDMFRAEWALQRGEAPLGLVLIVDDDPQGQYLAPEFELFKQLMLRHGIGARISDPGELAWQGGRLWHAGQVVDLVYNRLTDFYLEEPRHLALRQAYEAGAVVLTPHPHAHALYADKRNLIALSEPALLASWGVPADDLAVLQAVVPQTRLVTSETADALWAQRRQLFFKPVAGFAAKAAYRGDKITRKVWAEIVAGDFVAQALVAPSQRAIEVDGVVNDLKFDLRAYVYAGHIQLLAARMYAGQTTNFRTQGGGFAPVIVLPVS